MRDLFSEGLLYLDLLEVYGSTHMVGELCGIAQSNAYRGAQACAKVLNLDLVKRDGLYQVGRNQDVQLELRRVAQRLRAREGGRLRCVADPWWLADSLQAPRDLLQHLPKRWLSGRRSLDLLNQGIVDLLVTRRLDVAKPIHAEAPLPIARPQAREPYGLLALSDDPVKLYTVPNHPLQAVATVRPEQLEAYPSPALALDDESLYGPLFRSHKLWNAPLKDRFLEPAAWERLALSDHTIVPSTPRAVERACDLIPGLKLLPLRYDTGLSDQDLLIFPLYLAREPRMQEAIRAVHASYQAGRSPAPSPSPATSPSEVAA
jgi:hypothetical protein